MGSATRTSLVAVKEALAAQAGVTLSTGEQLLSAGRATAGAVQLRSLFADPSRDESEKSRLIATVFPSMDPAATALLTTVVTSRWSSDEDLLDGIEEAGIRAIASAAGAKATIESELFAFGRAVASDPELELAVGSKLGDPVAKAALVDRLLAGKAGDGAVLILRHLVQSPRGRRIGALIDDAARIVADANGRLIARVTVAEPLREPQRRRISAAIQQRYGAEPRIDVVVDPSVIGGLRIQVGDEVIDGTIAARLADLRLQLAG